VVATLNSGRPGETPGWDDRRAISTIGSVASEHRQRVVAAAARLPVVRRPAVRRAVVVGRRGVLRARRRAAERLGRRSLSRPALHELDRKLEDYLPWRDGFFVEAGGYDGYEQSNTYYLERFKGWRGALVEPIPELYRLCVRERPGSRVFQCALVAPEDEGTEVEMRYGGLVSTVKGAFGDDARAAAHTATGDMGGWDRTYRVRVAGRTLSSVLDEAALPRIDLLSLDVEGYEVPVLRGLDLDRHAARYLLIEMRELETMRSGIEALLGPRYVPVEPLSPYDMLYRRADEAAGIVQH
jgi:FkbM family methyltransferase